MNPYGAVAALAFPAAVVTAAWVGHKIPFGDQWPLFEALRTTAGIIFAVMGIWWAVAYPEHMKKALRGEWSRQPAEFNKGGERLFRPMAYSAFVLGAVVLIGVLGAFVKALGPWEASTVAALRGASFGMLVLLTLWQLYTLLLAIVPGSMLKDLMDREAHLDAMYGSGRNRKPSAATGD